MRSITVSDTQYKVIREIRDTFLHLPFRQRGRATMEDAMNAVLAAYREHNEFCGPKLWTDIDAKMAAEGY